MLPFTVLRLLNDLNADGILPSYVDNCSEVKGSTRHEQHRREFQISLPSPGEVLDKMHRISLADILASAIHVTVDCDVWEFG